MNREMSNVTGSTSLTVGSIAKAFPVDLGLPLCTKSFCPWTSGTKRTCQEICFLLLLIYENWIRRIQWICETHIISNALLAWNYSTTNFTFSAYHYLRSHHRLSTTLFAYFTVSTYPLGLNKLLHYS